MISPENIIEINKQFQNLEPRDILQRVLAEFSNVTVSFSGAEDVALVMMAWKLKKDIKIFTLDTGRLHPETYRFIDTVSKEFDLDLDILYPDTSAIEKLTSAKGLFSFYQDGHEECCGTRKNTFEIQPARQLALQRCLGLHPHL